MYFITEKKRISLKTAKRYIKFGFQVEFTFNDTSMEKFLKTPKEYMELFEMHGTVYINHELFMKKYAKHYCVKEGSVWHVNEGELEYYVESDITDGYMVIQSIRYKDEQFVFCVMIQYLYILNFLMKINNVILLTLHTKKDENKKCFHLFYFLFAFNILYDILNI